ncbi:hypothetical protein SPHINGO8BC_140225 [Sphingobacterium multivorum]|uniref:Uncharacterized protein n=1 Tax=Sphingobacterium multivorum TaxID=28454 RepID=A0A653ZM84_SPHMU|nr:hypothetical protein SPHINGO8BC_140225 [Sphingobacterium multivorum]
MFIDFLIKEDFIINIGITQILPINSNLITNVSLQWERF